MSRTGYLFDTGQDAERRRLEAQTSLWDPFTFRRLAETGIGEGWRCLEVGGGTGSVAAWLHERVGSEGHVVVTDLETRWLSAMATPNLEVRRHDVVADPVEEASFDLIHTRLVLMHLPQREAVLAKLAAALRSGGWLVVDDIDVQAMTATYPAQPTWTRISDAMTNVLEAAGADASFGRRLPAALRALGLADVDVQGIVVPRRAPEMAPIMVPVIEQLRERIAADGLVTAAELDQTVTDLRDESSELWVYSPLMLSARGRR